MFITKVVDQHKLADCFRTTLAKVSIRDYGEAYGFSDRVVALDLDAIETARMGRHDKTMDAAIGIADYVANRIVSSRLLLVEMRMNYGGQGENSKSSEMKAKDQHSRSLLAGCVLDKKSIFLFNKKVAPTKRNQINREAMVDSSLKNWEILSPEDFSNLFNFVEDLPYIPESPIDEIRNEGKRMIANANYEKVILLVNHWLGKVAKYYECYKVEECKALIGVVEDILSAVKNHKEELEENTTLLDYLIAEEQLANYKGLFKL